MRGHTHLSADCSPHTRRIAGGGADSRISELSEGKHASEFPEFAHRQMISILDL